jgi:uncharacterized protein DUF6457
MSDLDDWVAAATEELGLKPGDVQPEVVLEVAREVAHQVLRPAAPLTAYLMGVAVGRGTDAADAAARISALALAWRGREGRETPAGLGREGSETAGGLGREGSAAAGGLGREGQQTPARPGREGPETVADPPTQ